MIPPLLAVGIALGYGAGGRRFVAGILVFGLFASAMWGAVVGVADASWSTALGGVLLGAMNVAIGSGVGLAAQHTIATRHRRSLR